MTEKPPSSDPQDKDQSLIRFLRGVYETPSSDFMKTYLRTLEDAQSGLSSTDMQIGELSRPSRDCKARLILCSTKSMNTPSPPSTCASKPS